jgi:hypothetical protein
MSTTWTPPRYPAGHPQAGAIIVDPEDDFLGEQPAEAPAPEPVKPEPAQAPSAGAAPRAFADLLPGAQVPKPPRTRDALTTAAIAILAVGLLVWGATRQGPPSAPQGQATAQVPTVVVPTAGPAATNAPASTALPPNVAPRALVAFFDYRDKSTATPIERGTAYTPIGRAGDRWLLIQVGDGQVWALAEDLGATVDPALPDLAPRPPAPAPTAAPVSAPASAPSTCVQVVIPLDVADVAGVPIGRVEGLGCTVAEAQANADALAAELRASRAPTPTKEARQ